jgi:hypothetical protein
VVWWWWLHDGSQEEVPGWVVLGCRVAECCSNVVEMWWKVKECLIKLMFLNWSCLLSSHDTSASFFVSC